MTRLTWPDFVARHPVGHLLIGVVSEAETTPSTWHLDLMAKLLAGLAKGPYALTVNRPPGALEIHCLLAEEPDLKKIGDAVGARLSAAPSVGGIQRSFKLDATTCQIIRKALELSERPAAVWAARSQFHSNRSPMRPRSRGRR